MEGNLRVVSSFMRPMNYAATNDKLGAPVRAIIVPAYEGGRFGGRVAPQQCEKGLRDSGQKPSVVGIVWPFGSRPRHAYLN